MTQPDNDYSDCLLKDRHLLQRWAKTLEKGECDAELQQKYTDRLAQSRAAVVARESSVMQVTFPAGLPVSERVEEIQKLIAENQVIVLCGETGSGKSTQLPKICLSLGRGIFGRIGHTQPRRLAARSLASRVSSEIEQEVGLSVGYKVRFADKVSESTRVKLLTDGMLLAEIQRDKYLNEYDTLIIDEAHERSLNIDFLMGYLKSLLPKRPDLKLIITSATIDPQKFSKHFYDAPIIEVSGRTYPVEVRYRPPPEDEENGGVDHQQGLIDAVNELSRESRGDILIFFPGEREIRESRELLRKQNLGGTELLPLYARLSPQEQARIFKPSGARHIVLATNVAETSLTVPGIRHVIDTGIARISRYSAKSKIQRLPLEPVSKASADQRKGRCGRVAEGVCIRLYSEEDFTLRDEFTEPEIQRTNLASVILQMQVLGFGDIEEFPFVDPPDSRMIKDGYRLLHELGAVDATRRVTNLGRKLARLPIDPRIGRMLLEAAHTGCLTELLIIGAALSIQDPRERPFDKQQQADESHALFADEKSDFIGFVNLWNFLQEHRELLTRRKFERLCRERFISPIRVREWMDVHFQLKEQMRELGYKLNEKRGSYEGIHQAVISGMLSHLGQRTQGKERDYLGARNTRFHIFPGSSQFSAQPKWIVAAELVETTKLYARGVATVQPEWIEKLAGHLVNHSYFEPHWQAKRGQVGAYERITLYGLTIVPRRRINYGPIDPVVSHDLFLRFGLTEGDMQTRAPFFRHNQELIADLHHEEAKLRRRDVLVDEEAIYQYYAKRIPEAIYSVAQLEKWLREQKNKKILHMRREDIVRRDSDLDEAQFPDSLLVGSTHLPMTYHFEPGNEADGVTLHVPMPLLNQLDTGRLDWLVPGLIEDKVIALIKGLPKALRRQFVPVPDFAQQALARMQPSSTPLHQSLALALKQITSVHIPEDQWQLESIEPFLRMRVKLLSADGMEVVTYSRDIQSLQRDYADEVLVESSSSKTNLAIEQDEVRDWDFGDLPDSVDANVAGVDMRLYPAVVDQGDCAAVRCLDSQARAASAHQKGLRRLLLMRLAPTVKDLRKRVKQQQAMLLQYTKVPARAGSNAKPVALDEQLVERIVDLAFDLANVDVRTQATFEALYDSGRSKLHEIADQVITTMTQVLASYHQLRKLLDKVTHISLLSSVKDVQAHMDRLVYQGFISDVAAEPLAQYGRYLKAIEMRVEKLQAGGKARDNQGMHEKAAIEEKWLLRDQQAREKGLFDERLDEIRWQLEELAISLFAQEVKTLYPISVKRIEKRWKELGL